MPKNLCIGNESKVLNLLYAPRSTTECKPASFVLFCNRVMDLKTYRFKCLVAKGSSHNKNNQIN